MHLLTTLAAGVRGAENGTVDIYRRGTSTRATYHTGYNAEGATTPTASVPLDSNGRLIAYVNEIADLVVKSSTGSTVASYTEMVGSSNVEVRSSGFTGTHYNTLVQAASNPATLLSILNLWNSENGAVDWNTLLDGAATEIDVGLGRLTGPVWYNVKDPTYGAVGDNSNDDTAKIQAAIDAAAAATYGGVVYFPPGMYRVSSTLSVPADVSLVGAGAVHTTLNMNHASNNLISIGGPGNGQQISGMTLRVAQANSGNLIVVTVASQLLLDNLYVGVGNNQNGDLIKIADSALTLVWMRNCFFQWGGATVGAINALGAAERIHIRDCHFYPPTACSSTNGWIYGRAMDIAGCNFRTDICTSGTFSVYKANSTTLDATIVGCKFQTSGGATVTGMELGTYVAASKFMESGNNAPGYEDANFTLYSYTQTFAHLAADVQLVTRETRHYRVSSNAATVSLPAKQYGTVMVYRSGTASATIDVLGDAPMGAGLRIIIEGGGTGTITWTQTIEAGTYSLSSILDAAIDNGSYSSVELMCVGGELASVWATLGAATNNVTL